MAFSRDSNAIVYLTFSNSGISVSGDGAKVSGTTVTIEKSGTYLAQGVSDEGNIVVGSNSVVLYLQHLELHQENVQSLKSKRRVWFPLKIKVFLHYMENVKM